MNKYRIIQVTTTDKKGLFKEAYYIQKNYGTILHSWINMNEEGIPTKKEADQVLEEILKNKTTTHLIKIIKVI